MSPQKNDSQFTRLMVSLGLSAVVLIGGHTLVNDLHFNTVLTRLLWPLVRLMALITLGLLIGQIIEAFGWTQRLAVVARPLFKFGKLGDRCSAAFTAAFFSGVAANAMLLDFYQEGHISRKQLYLSNFVNQLPAFLLHLPTTFFIIIPLTGWAGALYFMLTFIAAVFRTMMFLLYGHLQPEASPADTGGKLERLPPRQPVNLTAMSTRIKKRLPGRLTGIVIYVIPIYVIVFVVNAMGLFDLLRRALAAYVLTPFVPMESLSVIILSFAAEFTSGFAAAGALLDAGILSIKQVVIALLIGNILAFPIRALRHQLPRYIGIYAPRMGTQILLMGQGFRIISIMFIGLIYFYVG